MPGAGIDERRLAVCPTQQAFHASRLRKPGAVDWPNPNLDVAYSEVWVAVDENCYLLVTVPKIDGRYHTVEFPNGWGETLGSKSYNLTFRFYGPRGGVADGTYYPPAIQKVN